MKRAVTKKNIVTYNKSINKYASVLLLGICLVTFLIYMKSIGYGFIYNWDDAGYIWKNNYIKEFSWENIKLIFSEFYFHNYHPITTLTYLVEYQLVKENAWLYHLNNIIIHIINTCLVFVFIKKIAPKRIEVALITAAFFAVHPMHVESVAWVSERKDVMYSMFFLLSLIYYTDYLKHFKHKFLIYSGVFFLLSCFSKSAAVTLPVVLLLLDYYNKREIKWRIIIEKIPFFTISLLFGILAILSQDTAIRDFSDMLSLFERLLLVMYGFLTYIYKTFLPVDLSAAYPYPLKSHGALPLLFFFAPLAVAAVLLFVWYSKKWGRDIIFGFLFFLVTISLVLQLMPVGGVIIAERYTYIPYAGLIFIVGKLYENLAESAIQKYRLYSKYLLFILIVGFFIFSYLANDRVKYWENGDILFSDVIDKYPKYPYAYQNRGFLYFDYYALKKYADNPEMKEKFVEKAYNDNTMAISLMPDYIQAYSNRGVLLYNTGRPKEALQDFNKLLELDPKHIEGLINRANTLSTLERFDKALIDYNNYIQLKDDNPKAYLWRGIAHYNLKNYNNAINDYNTSIKIDNTNYEPFYLKGLVFNNIKKLESAVENFNLAEARNNNIYAIYVERGLSDYELENYEKAIEDFTKAIELKPSELSNYLNRSFAYDKLQQYEKAYEDLIYVAEKGYPISKDYFMRLKKVK